MGVFWKKDFRVRPGETRERGREEKKKKKRREWSKRDILYTVRCEKRNRYQ